VWWRVEQRYSELTEVDDLHGVLTHGDAMKPFVVEKDDH
jgi:hypothetical protein